VGTKKVGRNAVLVELVRMRKEIESLINSLTGDENREFVKNINGGASPSIRTPRAGENLLTSDEIEAKYGIVEDHSGTLSPEFMARFGHLTEDARM
jgi:hypothetical protein